MCVTNYDELVIRISNKDKKALEELYTSLKSSVYSVGLAIVKNKDVASDIMQNVFVRIWDMAYQYRSGTDAKAWIIKITRNMAFQQLKNQKREMSFEIHEDSLTTDNDVSMEKLVISELLSTLKSTERQIVMMYTVCGYSHKEISKIIGIPYATVRWKYAAALKKLLQVIRREDLYGKHEQTS